MDEIIEENLKLESLTFWGLDSETGICFVIRYYKTDDEDIAEKINMECKAMTTVR